MSLLLRVWQNCDIEGIKAHLLIVGELTADCAACRELGIAYQTAKTCPKCGTEFRFITARHAGKLDRSAVGRVKQRRPDLVLIDYEDYKNVTGKQSAREFFK